MKNGDLFEFYRYEGDYEHVCQVDFDGAKEEEIRTVLAAFYQVDPKEIRIIQQSLCTHERENIQKLSNYWQAWNVQKGLNEYEGLPSSFFLKEMKPNEIYRVILDKKKNELEVVLNNGSAITLSVDAQQVEKTLFVDN